MVSTSVSVALAAQVIVSTIAWTASAALPSSRLRTSASIVQRSGTTFAAAPPLITPTFAVVSSSILPSRIDSTALAAAPIALRPSSGRRPACAERPRNSAWTA